MSSRSHDLATRRMADQYDAEAQGYYRHWAPVLHPIACKLVAELPDHNVRRVLDLGAGVGLLLPVLKEKFPDAFVMGADRSPGMLALADPATSVAVMDAARISVQDRTFDLAVMAFMLFHIPDPHQGLAEARRVLRAGGVLALTTWANDLETPAVEIWNEELEAHGAATGESLNRIAQHELMDSPEKVRALLEATGFASVQTRAQAFTHPIAPEEFMRMRTHVGSNKQRFESLDKNARERCVARVQERLSRLSPADFTLRMEIVFAAGTAPA